MFKQVLITTSCIALSLAAPSFGDEIDEEKVSLEEIVTENVADFENENEDTLTRNGIVEEENEDNVLASDEVTIVEENEESVLASDDVTIIEEDEDSALASDDVTIIKEDEDSVLASDDVSIVEENENSVLACNCEEEVLLPSEEALAVAIEEPEDEIEPPYFAKTCAEGKCPSLMIERLREQKRLEREREQRGKVAADENELEKHIETNLTV